MRNAVRRIGDFALGRGDEHLKELISKGAVTFAYRSTGVLLTFMLQIALARELGAYQFGIYSICISLMMLLSSSARLGLDLALVRKIAESVANGMFGMAKAWLKQTVKVSMLASTLVAVLLYATADMLAEHLYGQAALARPLQTFAFLIPATALMSLLAEALKGLREVAAGAIVQSVVVPLLLLSSVVLLQTQLDVLQIAFMYLAACVASIAYGYHRWHSVVPKTSSESIPASDVLRFGWPFFLANIGSMLLTWSDTVILGMFVSSEVVAGYYASSKLATITSFILISINAISAPKFAAMHSHNDLEGLQRLARQSTTVMIALAIIPIVLLVAFPEFWLSFFGKGFGSAQVPLVILTIGQAINVGCGSVGLLLAMTGHERIMSRIFIATAVFTICTSIILSMKWGSTGMAIATAGGMSAWNLWMLVAVRKQLGFWTFPLLVDQSAHYSPQSRRP